MKSLLLKDTKYRNILLEITWYIWNVILCDFIIKQLISDGTKMEYKDDFNFIFILVFHYTITILLLLNTLSVMIIMINLFVLRIYRKEDSFNI